MTPLKAAALVSALLGLTACADWDSETLHLGVVSGPETQLAEAAKKYASEEYDLNINIVVFNDYITPNIALREGSIDANAYQHIPFLEETNKAKSYHLVPVALTFVYPMGLYSEKIEDLSELRFGAIVAVPNDPTNGGRALLILEQTGLITLKDGAGPHSTVRDVIDNPLNLRIRPIDAPQLPRILADVDLAAINTTFAIPAGLLPFRDALFVEGRDSLFANVIATRADNQDDPRISQLIAAFQSEAVVEEANRLFKGQAIPAW